MLCAVMLCVGLDFYLYVCITQRDLGTASIYVHTYLYVCVL